MTGQEKKLQDLWEQARQSFWDEHDATEVGKQTDMEFEINIQSQRRYYPIDHHLSSKIQKVAKERGISEETLLNLWVQEKLNQTENEQKAEQDAGA